MIKARMQIFTKLTLCFSLMLRSRQILKVLYNIAMKKLLKSLIILYFMVFAIQATQAEEHKVLVLPDNIQFDSTNYLVYPDSSIIFASDTINEIKKSGVIQTVSMAEVRDALRKDTKLKILTKNALKEFKYNYNIPFVDFKSIAHCFSTNKVLIITSQTDIQNYFLRRTLWDFLNIPGATVIDPAYKLSTYAALIDVDKEQVIWQNTYYKSISSMENRMIAQNFAPATEQLEKLRLYSTSFLSPTVANIVQAKLLPPLPLNQNGITEVTNETPNEVILPLENDLTNFRPKINAPNKTNPKSYGAVINDL